MSNKSLLVRLFLSFILISTITILIIDNKKEESLNHTLLLEKQKLRNSYENAFERIKDKADLILNNNLYDEKLYTYFVENKKKELYSYLKDDFFYLKSKGLKQLSFYNKKNELFLKMNDSLSSKTNITYELKKDITFFNLLKEDATIGFSKSIYDKNLLFKGTVFLEFSVNSLITDIMQDIDYNVFLLFPKINIDSKIYEEFILNNEYFIKNDNFTNKRYDTSILEKIVESSNYNLKIEMKNSSDLSFLYKNDNFSNPVFLMPLDKTFFNKNIYLFAYMDKKESLYMKIKTNYNLFIFFVIVLYSILLFVIYKYLNTKSKNNSLKKEHEDLLKAIDSYVVMVETDTKGVITFATQAFCNICGYSKDELLNRNINILRHPDVSPKFFEVLWQKLKQDHKWEGEIKNLNKFANSYWVKGTIIAKYDANNRVCGYTSIRVNTTDSKQLKKINSLLKEDLSNKLNEIKMKDKNLLDSTKVALMSKVLDAVAHQWKNPISNISIDLASLKAKLSANKINKNELFEINENIEKELKSLAISLNEFKSFFTKTQSNDKYDINQVIKEAITSLKEEINSLNVSVVLNSKENILCFGVHNEFKHIFVNLIKNSLKEIKTNSVKNPVVEISIIEDKSDIVIKYCDNLNIKNRVIEEVFSQDDSNTNIEEEDISIYITKLLIQKAGAKVWFENNSEENILYMKLVSEDRRKSKR